MDVRHINFLENKPNVAGKGPTWLFDPDYLTDSMNYHLVRSENQANMHAGQQEANHNAGTEGIIDAGEDKFAQDCFVLPIWSSYSSTITPDLKTDEKREDRLVTCDLPFRKKVLAQSGFIEIRRMRDELLSEIKQAIQNGCEKCLPLWPKTDDGDCCTPILRLRKLSVKDEGSQCVDVHLYRSMISSLMYSTASRPDNMFAVSKGQTQTGSLVSRVPIWTGILLRCDYVAQYLDRNPQQVNPVYHSKTKHIAIRHHFIRDAYEKKLIQVLKIHTDDNVADLLIHAHLIESLIRVSDGTKALLLPTLFTLRLDKVSTDSAKLVPLGKVCTAIETLKKNTAKALISLLTMITLSTTMAILDSCPKHNMVAYLEKSEGNAEFHKIIDFLMRSFIHHALTISPVVSTTFVEQFWTSAKSKILNNVRHITAKVAGKSVSISEASIRSELLFNDASYETDVTQKHKKQSQIRQNRAREQKEMKRKKSGSKSQQKVNPDKAKVNPVKLNQENVT
ncbi:hypothetical protein Tco_1146342 [Tanacetum coccineum]